MSLFHARVHQWTLALGTSVMLSGLARSVALAQDTTSAHKDSASTHTLPPMEIHGFVQVYYRSGDPLNKDGFRLRKADMKFTGDLSEHLHWRIGFDAAKNLAVNSTSTQIHDTTALASAGINQATRMLQEAAVTYTVNKSFGIDVGQQLLPLSLEGWIPLANLETIDRTNFIAEHSRAVALGYVFDLGVSANGTTPQGIEYHAGVFNEMGDSQGTTDTNDQKALIGSLAYHIPMVPGLQLGGSGGYEPGAFDQLRQRVGTDAQYKHGILTFRGETMAARDGALRRFGWYGLSAVQVTRRVELSARYDSWDRDRTAETSVSNAFERQVLVGGNYAVDGTTGKIALNIIRQTFPNISSVPAATFALFAFQAAF